MLADSGQAATKSLMVVMSPGVTSGGGSLEMFSS
jgi:hypothetical protein